MIEPGKFNLPAAAIAESVNEALAESGVVVVCAPPGAGKSTLLPLTMLQAIPEGKILMLEPRRIAARQIAGRMAQMLGETVGQTVGYRIRFETRTSPITRIEVLTEGILSRMLADDPALEGVSAIIFDEFHERSLASDLALALARGTRAILRPDLLIAVMSATIDAQAIASALGAKVIESPGRCFPVEIIHCDDIAGVDDIPQACAHQTILAHRKHEGDILVFLPGEAEIRRCAQLLEGPIGGNTDIYPLYGTMPMELQRLAIEPSKDGRRRIVLATPVAETSLTIEGVRIVVDSGWCKKMIYDTQNGLSHLETVRISMDMAEQRAGRAGRVAEGICYRLWSTAIQNRMAAFRTPEILEADLSSACLDAAAWGEPHLGALEWINQPPSYAVTAAERLLESLGAIKEGKLTGHGKALAAIPCHPRIANMLCAAEGKTGKSLAADMAALLEERDPLGKEYGADFTLRLEKLRKLREENRLERGWNRIGGSARQYARLMHAEQDNSAVFGPDAGYLLAMAYPSRVARRKEDGHNVYLLSSGECGYLDSSDPLGNEEWIVVTDINARKDTAGKIHMAAPVAPDDLKNMASWRKNLGWDSRSGSIAARSELRIGCLTLESRDISDISREEAVAIIAQAALKEGTSMFDFNDKVRELQRRLAAVSAWHPELEIPDSSTEAVLADAAQWLPMYAEGARSTAQLKKIDMAEVIWNRLEPDLQQSVDRLAPKTVEVPTGSRIHLEYRQGAEAPILRVRLQECFGMKATPRVDSGRIPVLMELLSPGFKPVQLTSDLESFWGNTYFEIRKELRRRYPKHSWPDNPLEAPATRGVRKKD